MAIFFALLTLVGWGVGDIFGALASKEIGNTRTFFWSHLLALVITSFYIPFAGKIESFGYFVLAFVLGVINASGTYFYFRGFEIGIVPLVGAIAGSFSFVSVLLSIVFFGEVINFLQFLGIVLTIVGVVLASLKLDEIAKLKRDNIFSDKSVRYALYTMMVWGIYFAFIRIPAEKIGWFWAYYPLNFTVFILILFRVVKGEVVDVLKKAKTLVTLVIFTLLVTTAMFAYNIAILFGYTTVVAPIAGSSPVLLVVLSRVVFKERLSLQQKVGIASALAGIILISSQTV